MPNYTLTPALLARARADIDRKREKLNKRYEAALATVASHENAVALLNSELGEIEACERMATAIAERYAPPPGSKRTKSGRLLPARSGLGYTPEEDARIIEAHASRGQMEQLAVELERTYDGVLKHYEEALAPSRDTSSEAPAQVEVHIADVPLGSENQDFVDPTDSHEATADDDVAAPDSPALRELAEDDGRRKRAGAARPGIPVRGLTDDGRGKERYLDPDAWASRGGGV
jgi:hypothetical protein